MMHQFLPFRPNWDYFFYCSKADTLLVLLLIPDNDLTWSSLIRKMLFKTVENQIIYHEIFKITGYQTPL
jgi:hypothetical protein